MDTAQKKNLLVIAGIAAAVILGIIIVVSLVSGPAGSPPVPANSNPAISSQGFDLKVLQRAGYKALDQRPVQDGLLPVKPPQLPGKANPFL